MTAGGPERGRAAEALGYTKAYDIIGYFRNAPKLFAMSKLTARRYDTLRPVAIDIETGKIERISLIEDQADLPLVAPGLVDLQINGFGGIEFNDGELTIEKVRQVAFSQDQFGVTAFLATCTTDSHELLKHALTTIAQAIRELSEVAARIPGIHLEGPFIAPERLGTHPADARRDPDCFLLERLLAAGPVSQVTLAPELPGARALLETAIEELHRQFGEADSDTAAAIGNLAAILWQFGERGEAYWLQAQLVETQRRLRGEDDPSTRTALAVLAAMQHDGMP